MLICMHIDTKSVTDVASALLCIDGVCCQSRGMLNHNLRRRTLSEELSKSGIGTALKCSHKIQNSDFYTLPSFHLAIRC